MSIQIIWSYVYIHYTQHIPRLLNDICVINPCLPQIDSIHPIMSGLFLSLDFLIKRWIEIFTAGHLHIRFTYLTKGVSGFATDSPRDVWHDGRTFASFMVAHFVHLFSTDFVIFKLISNIAIWKISESQTTSLVISQHRFRQWLGDIRQQTITWIHVPDPCRHVGSLGHDALCLCM